MNNKLTKYNSFEEMKQDVHPVALASAEKKRLDAETKQMAEILHAVRTRKQSGNARK